ncbi:phospholipase D family protein [Cupriavidus consociatus]|uniref:phospholipase D family protein n=1 Tax=Cupriavidus consociatus TaxID=2821357 RepID=UPI001AE5AA30|nr:MULTISPECIES: phospholipase D family protein [unclassified Cupriavidus]MBP0619935.1 phospholipase D family protein [Cupriavidus sp. LEh25]MDK2656590.1 phospholipase D family protein [Cupriavidus sp. LEh21]
MFQTVFCHYPSDTCRQRSQSLAALPLAITLTLALAMGLTGCASLPASAQRPPSNAPAATATTTDTPLGKALAPRLAQRPGESLFYPLSSGPDALAARLAMARAAQRSLDLQTYILEPTGTGAAVLGDIIDAADRGVRVRMLLDDLRTGGEVDKILSAIDSHPNIEVRLFNPFANRSLRWLEMLADFSRLDRRMHNKSMTVDNQMSVVGGRNIGDAYFSARTDMDFSDLDVLIAGPAVPQVSAVFDEYWNDESSYPVVALIPEGKEAPVEMRSLRKRLEARGDQAKASQYVQELLESGLAKGIESGRMPAYTGKATVVSDKAAKITHQTHDDPGHATARLEKMISGAQKEVMLISPYFVPDDDGEAWLIAIAKRGIRVRILTNSFAATDVSAVHAGYAPHREALVAAGIELYELKPSAYAELAQRGKAAKGSRSRSWLSSSRASLHAKNYIVDRRLVFIGSLNMDPRSARLNTEMGIVLDSPALAERMIKTTEDGLLDMAYRIGIRTDADGNNARLTWTTRDNGQLTTYDSEPGMGALQHLGIGVLRVLPIKEEL